MPHAQGTLHEALTPLIDAPPVVSMTMSCSHTTTTNRGHGRSKSRVVTHNATEYLGQAAWRDTTEFPSAASNAGLLHVAVLFRLQADMEKDKQQFQ
eukprot:CAMPEP_0172774988 /NCGR_PEP_ID=MMETSP1074-20121228/197196_1 /TAXON_ID=2916 /ORGANISM="Ceratium fusus, Strain PA161109" /LENGTH=95 /DNA_ID=CAMNT_0013611515 /DNA_START=57 /DNA_END=341 /DNA_ORIENTATION=+